MGGKPDKNAYEFEEKYDKKSNKNLGAYCIRP
jgi:hypothetical protein